MTLSQHLRTLLAVPFLAVACAAPDGDRTTVSDPGDAADRGRAGDPATATEAVAPAPAPYEGPREPVFLVATVNGQHDTSEAYSTDVLRAWIEAIGPDVVLVDVPVDRFDAAWSEFTETGTVTEERVKYFPEYTDVVFPLAQERGWEVVPYSTWSIEGAERFRRKLAQARKDRAEDYAELAELFDRYEKIIEGTGVERQPEALNSPEYALLIQDVVDTYDEKFAADFGADGLTAQWDADFANIRTGLESRFGEDRRFLILTGAAERVWFTEKLTAVPRFEVLDPREYL